jgi:hypothetical protein
VKHSLLSAGFGDVWHYQGVSIPNNYVCELSQVLHDKSVQGYGKQDVLTCQISLISLHTQMSFSVTIISRMYTFPAQKGTYTLTVL